MTKEKNPDQILSDDAVIAFLKANPDFLIKNPDLLEIMTPPAQHSGKGVVDFQQYMVKRLKADRDEVLETAREIVATTRANMNSQARIHTAILTLLEAHSFEEFIHAITMDMASILNVDIISLIVESDGAAIPHIGIAGLRAAAPGAITQIMKDKTIILEGGVTGFDLLYGGGASLVKSQALVRLQIGPGAPPALLAFGSRDPALFDHGQGTELINFLGKATERIFRSWLMLPQE